MPNKLEDDAGWVSVPRIPDLQPGDVFRFAVPGDVPMNPYVRFMKMNNNSTGGFQFVSLYDGQFYHNSPALRDAPVVLVRKITIEKQ